MFFNATIKNEFTEHLKFIKTVSWGLTELNYFLIFVVVLLLPLKIFSLLGLKLVNTLIKPVFLFFLTQISLLFSYLLELMVEYLPEKITLIIKYLQSLTKSGLSIIQKILNFEPLDLIDWVCEIDIENFFNSFGEKLDVQASGILNFKVSNSLSNGVDFDLAKLKKKLAHDITVFTEKNILNGLKKHFNIDIPLQHGNGQSNSPDFNTIINYFLKPKKAEITDIFEVSHLTSHIFFTLSEGSGICHNFCDNITLNLDFKIFKYIGKLINLNPMPLYQMVLAIAGRLMLWFIRLLCYCLIVEIFLNLKIDICQSITPSIKVVKPLTFESWMLKLQLDILNENIIRVHEAMNGIYYMVALKLINYTKYAVNCLHLFNTHLYHTLTYLIRGRFVVDTLGAGYYTLCFLLKIPGTTLRYIFKSFNIVYYIIKGSGTILENNENVNLQDVFGLHNTVKIIQFYLFLESYYLRVSDMVYRSVRQDLKNTVINFLTAQKSNILKQIKNFILINFVYLHILTFFGVLIQTMTITTRAANLSNLFLLKKSKMRDYQEFFKSSLKILSSVEKLIFHFSNLNFFKFYFFLLRMLFLKLKTVFKNIYDNSFTHFLDFMITIPIFFILTFVHIISQFYSIKNFILVFRNINITLYSTDFPVMGTYLGNYLDIKNRVFYEILGSIKVDKEKRYLEPTTNWCLFRDRVEISNSARVPARSTLKIRSVVKQLFKTCMGLYLVVSDLSQYFPDFWCFYYLYYAYDSGRLKPKAIFLNFTVLFLSTCMYFYANLDHKRANIKKTLESFDLLDLMGFEHAEKLLQILNNKISYVNIINQFKKHLEDPIDYKKIMSKINQGSPYPLVDSELLKQLSSAPEIDYVEKFKKSYREKMLYVGCHKPKKFKNFDEILRLVRLCIHLLSEVDRDCNTYLKEEKIWGDYLISSIQQELEKLRYILVDWQDFRKNGTGSIIALNPTQNASKYNSSMIRYNEIFVADHPKSDGGINFKNTKHNKMLYESHMPGSFKNWTPQPAFSVLPIIPTILYYGVLRVIHNLDNIKNFNLAIFQAIKITVCNFFIGLRFLIFLELLVQTIEIEKKMGSITSLDKIYNLAIRAHLIIPDSTAYYHINRLIDDRFKPILRFRKKTGYSSYLTNMHQHLVQLLQTAILLDSTINLLLQQVVWIHACWPTMRSDRQIKILEQIAQISGPLPTISLVRNSRNTIGNGAVFSYRSSTGLVVEHFKKEYTISNQIYNLCLDWSRLENLPYWSPWWLGKNFKGFYQEDIFQIILTEILSADCIIDCADTTWKSRFYALFEYYKNIILSPYYVLVTNSENSLKHLNFMINDYKKYYDAIAQESIFNSRIFIYYQILVIYFCLQGMAWGAKGLKNIICGILYFSSTIVYVCNIDMLNLRPARV